MKTILTAIAFFCCSFVFAGTISPSANNEYCPLQELYFDITYAGNWDFYTIQLFDHLNARLVNKTYDNNNNITTFHIGIIFDDIPLTHSIRIEYYPNGGGTHVAETFNFPKIKSLYNDSRQVSPGIGSITAPYCVTTTTNISFSNLPWRNGYTSPSYFGTITQYDYSVPAGWSVNGSVSSGPSDIKHGSNSATIVSDGVTGGNLIITPVNSACGNTTFSGNPLVIPIIRDRPSLTFQSLPTICSSSTFQANGVPAWVTGYQWAVNPSTAFSFSNANANPTTISNNGSSQADLSLVISGGTACPISFTYNTMEITGAAKLTGGLPLVTTSLAIYNAPGDENDVCFGIENYISCVTTGGSYPTWTDIAHSGSPLPSYNGSDQDIYIYFFNSHQNSIVLRMSSTNTCGTTTYDFGFKPVSCARIATPEYNYQISPNPTRGIIHITKKSTDATAKQQKKGEVMGITRISVYDLQHNLRLTKTFDSAPSATINIGGLKQGNYFVTITSGDKSETQQVILQ